MLKHFLYRFLLAAVALLILAMQSITTNSGGGNSGMDVKWWLFLALAILALEGLYLIYETLSFLFKAEYRLAAINLVILVAGIVGVLFLASNA